MNRPMAFADHETVIVVHSYADYVRAVEDARAAGIRIAGFFPIRVPAMASATTASVPARAAPVQKAAPSPSGWSDVERVEKWWLGGATAGFDHRLLAERDRVGVLVRVHHEAAHAVLHVVHGNELLHVSALADQTVTAARVLADGVESLRGQLVSCVAGAVGAELLHPAHYDHGGTGDGRRADVLAATIANEAGTSAEAEIRAARNRAAEVVSSESGRRGVRLLAVALLRRGALDGREAEDIVLRTLGTARS